MDKNVITKFYSSRNNPQSMICINCNQSIYSRAHALKIISDKYPNIPQEQVQEELQKITLKIIEQEAIYDENGHLQAEEKKIFLCPYCNAILSNDLLYKIRKIEYETGITIDAEAWVLSGYQRYDYVPQGPTALERIEMLKTFINNVPIKDEQSNKYSNFIDTIRYQLEYI